MDGTIFQYDFVIKGLLGAVFASITAGIAGTYIVSRRMVFLSGGITHASFGGIGIGLVSAKPFFSLSSQKPGRIGIIGLDTSHSIAFTKAINSSDPKPELAGFRIVTAYPKGSSDIKSSADRIEGYTEEVKKLGVGIAGSIDELLSEVDYVLLETNDGRLHLEQALAVFKAGKRVFIDKPLAASLEHAIAIFNAADHYKVPVFTSSSLRYIEGVQEIAAGKIGKVTGADTFSPCTLEKTHPDLFWYGIHGVETLFTIMGPGCQTVARAGPEKVVGVWKDGRNPAMSSRCIPVPQIDVETTEALANQGV